MNWNAVIGPVCVLFGVLVALYVKDQARNVAKQEFAENIAAALAVFKVDLVAMLTEHFVPRGEAAIRIESQAREVAQLSNRLDIHNERLMHLEGRGQAVRAEGD
jgi:hypothetical protein